MEARLCREQTCATCRSTGEFDGGFDSFAATAAEENFGESTTGESAETFGKLASQVRNIALQHDGATFIKLVFDGTNDVRMIVAGVVNAIAGKKVNDTAAIRGEEFRTEAARVFDIQTEQVQQGDPLRVYIFGVGISRSGSQGSRCHIWLWMQTGGLRMHGDVGHLG